MKFSHLSNQIGGVIIRPVFTTGTKLANAQGSTMSQNMNLMQSQRQTQILAPQMRQSLDMLLMTHLELRAELQRQLATNPLIEDVATPMERVLSSELPEEHVSGAISERELDFTPTGQAAQETLACDDADRDYYLQNIENYTVTPESGFHDPDAQSRRQLMFDRQVKGETLQEHLRKQIPLSDIPEQSWSLAEFLTEHINDEGYFKGSIADIQMVSGATESQILTILSKISDFDPVGCGGRNLKECLLFQMEKLDDSPWEDEVRAIIENHLEDVAAHHETIVCESLGIDRADYPKVIAELRKLDPMPGRGFQPQEDASIYVRPEVFVRKNKDGKWVVRVEDRDLPKIHLSNKYIKMLEDPNCTPETKSYIRERLRAAETLLQSIAERQSTIYNIAQAIVDAQSRVFEEKSLSALKPLTMDQIAQKIGVHNATVSRAVRNKYMETPLGLIELRKFFVSGLQTQSGNTVSNMAVKEQIRKIVESEDKAAPLSDDAISKALDAVGIKCARRTVSKYREMIGIGNAIERRIQ